MENVGKVFGISMSSFEVCILISEIAQNIKLNCGGGLNNSNKEVRFDLIVIFLV